MRLEAHSLQLIRCATRITRKSLHEVKSPETGGEVVDYIKTLVTSSQPSTKRGAVSASYTAVMLTDIFSALSADMFFLLLFESHTKPHLPTKQ